MKLPYKKITVVTLLGLLGVCIMQTYWLVGLYHSMSEKTENAIERSIREADTQELFARFKDVKEKYANKSLTTFGSKEDGDYRVSALVNMHIDSLECQSYVEQTQVITERNGKYALVADSGRLKAAKDDSAKVMPASSLNDFALELQRGMHFAIHKLGIEVNLSRFDHLLTQELTKDNITAQHYTQIVNLDKRKIVATTQPRNFTDLSGYTAHQMIYDDVSDRLAYRVFLKSTNQLVLQEMTGVILSSILILLLLCTAFGYLIRTIRRMKSMEEIKEDFTHNITHELKTPIAVAYAANDAMLNFSNTTEHQDEKERKYELIIQQQLNDLTSLVEQILSMNMEQRKGFVLHYESIRLKPLLEELINRHRLSADKEVTFTNEVIPDTLTIKADRTHLFNMIGNLIDNAIKYSDSPAWVSIKALSYQQKVYISIADKGCGIENEKQKHLFEKFYRVPQGNHHDVKGYGLGLFYVKTLAEKHHGGVTVNSTLGQGSIFTLILPEK